MFNISGLIAIVSLVFMSFVAHDFYTSMTKVDYNKASETIQFSTKLDVEHIEAALGKKRKQHRF